MLEFLKRERRKSEKIVQQSKERDKDKEVDNKNENKDRRLFYTLPEKSYNLMRSLL